MHHGVRVRVFFRRSSEHHSRNDSSSSSSSTSWSHGPYDIYTYISSCVFTGPTVRTSYSFFVLCLKSGVYPCRLEVFWYHKLFATASDCLRLVLNQQARLPTLNSRNSTTNSSSTHQPTAALQIDQSLYHTWELCRQPGFTACSARE